MSLNSLLEDYTPCSQNKTFWLASGIFSFIFLIFALIFSVAVFKTFRQDWDLSFALLVAFRIWKVTSWLFVSIGQGEDVLKGSQITYVTGVEGEDVISAQVATVTQSGLGQQVALISQDGTQHVSNCSVTCWLNHAENWGTACSFSKGSLKSHRILDKCWWKEASSELCQDIFRAVLLWNT